MSSTVGDQPHTPTPYISWARELAQKEGDRKLRQALKQANQTCSINWKKEHKAQPYAGLPVFYSRSLCCSEWH